FPRNYFTLFGQSYPVQRYETITYLCPPDSCGRPPAAPLGQALDDAALVYQHRVLPEPWREGLTPIDEGWGRFGESAGGDASAASEGSPSSGEEQGPNDLLNTVPKDDRGKRAQLDIMVRQARMIDADPSINFVHVLVPHTPYVLT